MRSLLEDNQAEGIKPETVEQSLDVFVTDLLLSALQWVFHGKILSLKLTHKVYFHMLAIVGFNPAIYCHGNKNNEPLFFHKKHTIHK